VLTLAIAFLILAIVAGVFAFLTTGPIAPMLLVAFLVFFLGATALHLFNRRRRRD